MGFILFFIYLILFSWLLTRIRFVKNAGLGAWLIVALFVLKVMAGVSCGWVMRNDINSDTWTYHKDALTEYHLLFTNPSAYFTNIFYTGYQYGYDGVLQFHNSYWNDLKTNLVVKFVSVLDIFSFGNYYINVLLYNFLVFFGHIALFRVFRQAYKNKTFILVASCFLLPSLLVFSSILHKEGLIFTSISFICYFFYTSFKLGNFTKKKIVLSLLSLIIIFLFRSYILIVLIPTLFAWLIANKKNYSPVLVFALVFTVSIFLFFNISYILPSVNLPQLVMQKQADFLGLAKANSFIGVHSLYPSFKSFVSNAPQAFNHTLLRPYFGDYSLSKPLLPFIAELFLYQILFILFLFFRNKETTDKAFLCFSISFTLMILIIIGYTVPVLWALIRYRSIYLPFLLIPLFCNIDWHKIKLFLKIIK